MAETADTFSARFRFADWPNPKVPQVAAGIYAVWEGDRLIYCGMSGRQFDPNSPTTKRRHGLFNRLASHATGRLSGDQFCVYVANRLVIPSLTVSHLPEFGSGALRLDQLTRTYIRERLEYQFVCVSSGAEAFALEARCRRGEVFGVKPFLNPAQ